MKNIDWLSPTQIKSLVDGGSMFFEIPNQNVAKLSIINMSEYLRREAKLQIGDEFYVKEEFYEDEEYLMYKNDINDFEPYTWFCKEDMQPDQSRVKGKTKNRELIMVHDLTIDQIEKISCMSSKVYSKENNRRAFKLDTIDYFNKICQEKNLNIAYDDNPYIILYEIIL
jgi:hypothetical protein